MDYAPYVLAQWGDFSKIIFGTDKLKKVDKLYSSYQINPNEKILAYIKNTVPLFGLMTDGTIITDQAIYFDPKHKDWAPINRFAFSEICSYVLTMSNDKAKVMADCEAGSYQIMSGTLLGKNIGGIELIHLIEIIQSNLILNHSWAKQQRDSVVAYIIKTAKIELQKGRLSSHSINLLDAIARNDEYEQNALIVKAEDIYRTFNMEEFNQFCHNHCQLFLSTDAIKEFEESFKIDLENVRNDFDKDFLRESSGNLSQLENISSRQLWILGYTYARLDDESNYQNVCFAIDEGAEEKASLPLVKFKCCYMNQRMRKVLDSILSSDEVSDEWISLTDNLGLTPLHYALILHKNEMVSKLLDKYKWESPSFPEEYEIFDYTVLASYLNLSNCEEVYSKTSQDVSALSRSKKNLEKRLWLKEKRLSFQETMIHQVRNALHTAKRQSADRSRILEVQEKLDDLISASRELEIEIEELKQDIFEIDSELQDMIQSGLANARNKAQQFANESDIFIRHLLHIFSDTAFLSHILNIDPNNCILYTYYNITFTIPNDVELGKTFSAHDNAKDEAYNTQDTHSQNTAQQASPINKPYGDSWFSPQAHHKIKILRQEYHLLAKQYHPDLCNHVRSKDIFQEILNEHADILDSMPT